MLEADKLLNCLPFTTLVDELAAMHREPIGLVDEMLMESSDAEGNANHFFVRSGWQPGKAVGAKVISIFPGNNRRQDYPSIQAVYVLFEGAHGSPLACLDGTALTWLKTAADSALGSSLLARDDVDSMLMIGAGQMAPHLVAAHCALRPSIARVAVWNRSIDKAERLCDELAARLPRIEFGVARDLERGVREAGLVCSAIGCSEPLIEGDWLQPGTHVDLVGAYTAEMREADDAVLTRGSLFVDARETTIHHIGELMIPLAAGVIAESDVRADLVQLCLGEHPGRESREEITVYKNGGGGHLDLMCARILHRHCQPA